MKSLDVNDKVIRRKKTPVFIFFLLAAIFWLVTNLAKNYTQFVDVEVEYINLTNDKILYKEPLNELRLLIEMTGFNLLLQKMSDQKITIDLSTVKKRRNQYFYVTANNIVKIQEQFSSDKTIVKVYPDTLFFDFGKLNSKKIKITPNIKINYKEGHSLIGDLEINPNVITIYGVDEEIDPIKTIDTKLLVVNDVKNDFEYTVLLDIPKTYNKIHFSAEQIKVKGIVEKYTEAQLDIPFELINVPNGYTIKTILKKIKVTYKVSLENYEKIDANDFKIICDFNKITQEGSFLIPQIIKKPNLISNMKWHPKKIEFLINK